MPNFEEVLEALDNEGIGVPQYVPTAELAARVLLHLASEAVIDWCMNWGAVTPIDT